MKSLTEKEFLEFISKFKARHLDINIILKECFEDLSSSKETESKKNINKGTEK
jgi:hypothetical protein